MKFPRNSVSLVSGHVKLGYTIIQNTFHFIFSKRTEKLTFLFLLLLRFTPDLEYCSKSLLNVYEGGMAVCASELVMESLMAWQETDGET